VRKDRRKSIWDEGMTNNSEGKQKFKNIGSEKSIQNVSQHFFLSV
jgi:hypothetical protein